MQRQPLNESSSTYVLHASTSFAIMSAASHHIKTANVLKTEVSLTASTANESKSHTWIMTWTCAHQNASRRDFIITARKLLRYALRSGSKSKEEKPPVAAESTINSASKRGRPASTLSKSVGVLDLSGKDKPAKPPRRLSNPPKPAGTPAPKLLGNITPISEARSRRSVKSETPASDVSKSTSRKKFSVLSSASYWLTQIKLSEAAGKHSISLGLFKLALEAGCEPLHRMRDELKSYVVRHNLDDLEDPLKELLESKSNVEREQMQISETCSQVPDEGTRSSDDDVKSCSSTMGTRKLKPKSLNTDAAPVSPVKASAKKEIAQKSIPATKTRGSLVKTSSNSGPVSDNGARGPTAKKPQKPSKQESNKVKDRTKKQGDKSAGSVSTTPAGQEALHENKENEDAPPMEDVSLTAEVV
ncbi:uncharacterized protein Pyn_12019 [Prunus yedoensis var. nudiflora]|uniref:Uncharacterized protein n=1 Tax=Prunus yedoensis var. nudiflora TaxID=2094558 RepID=A0A314YPP8_PRUYE|nr:uncharacterized protein Pyn_12019 [Prunus yedoensis var. nudiflora]